MAFLDEIKAGCLAGWTFGILPSVSAAQAILESDWGRSDLAKSPHHNLFGIKASADWKGKTVTLWTKEVVGGETVSVEATFRTYDSWADSIMDHALFFTDTDWRRRNYHLVVGEKAYKRACYALQAAGYATDPTYASKLIHVIETHHLTTWDQEVLGKTDKEKTMAKHLVICGHGQGRTGYDPGAVNKQLGITEASKVREFAALMKRYSGREIDYITEQNVYDYRSLANIGKGYASITELHFNAFNGQAKGTEILIYSGYQPDQLDQQLLSTLGRVFVNRGFKKVNWLYHANVSAERGYNYRLVELCFIDNHSDMTLYEQHKDQLAKRFVEAITGRDVSASPSLPAPHAGRPQYHVGDSVVLEKHATHYQTGQAIKGWAKGRTYKIIRVKDVKQSNSQRAYLLDGIRSWVLEQDVTGTTDRHSEQTYRVQKGDTLYSIARTFKTTHQELTKLNSLTNPNQLSIGQTLVVK